MRINNKNITSTTFAAKCSANLIAGLSDPFAHSNHSLVIPAGQELVPMEAKKTSLLEGLNTFGQRIERWGENFLAHKRFQIAHKPNRPTTFWISIFAVVCGLLMPSATCWPQSFVTQTYDGETVDYNNCDNT